MPLILCFDMLDPNVSLVILHVLIISAQVELGEGEKGWKDVEDKSSVKHPGFSQVCSNEG